MNAPVFTPGPWRLDGSSSIYALNLEGPNRFYANVQSGWSTAGRNRTSEAELAANAHLIAAAPELLDQCERAATILHNVIESGQIGRGYATNLADLQAVIAKATQAVKA